MGINNEVINAQKELDGMVKHLAALNNSVAENMDEIKDLKFKIKEKKLEIYHLTLEETQSSDGGSKK